MSLGRIGPDGPAIRELTSARVGLGRAGGSMPTGARLAFRADHARARDAVNRPFDGEALARALQGDGHRAIGVRSAAATRADYVRRPDLGRMLAPQSVDALARMGHGPCDLAIVLCDGLSPRAIERHGPSLAGAIVSNEQLKGWSIGPVGVVTNGRVAIGDEIGQALGAQIVVVLIGERPGLSVPESIGLYVTHGPEPGRTDAERSCISNIHEHGLSIVEATRQLAGLVVQARLTGTTGVALAVGEPLSVEESRTR